MPRKTFEDALSILYESGSLQENAVSVFDMSRVSEFKPTISCWIPSAPPLGQPCELFLSFYESNPADIYSSTLAASAVVVDAHPQHLWLCPFAFKWTGWTCFPPTPESLGCIVPLFCRY